MQSGENMEMLAQRKPNFWIAFGINKLNPKLRLLMKHFPLYLCCLCLLLLALFSYFFLDKELLITLPEGWKKGAQLCSFVISPAIQLTAWAAAYIIARLKKHRYAHALFQIAAAQCLSVIVVRIIKVATGRSRPTLFLKKAIYGFHGWHLESLYHSFPSGHSATAFTLATSLAFFFPRYRIPFFATAVICSSSRLFLHKHFLSDIIVGAVIGIVAGNAMYYLYKKKPSRS